MKELKTVEYILNFIKKIPQQFSIYVILILVNFFSWKYIPNIKLDIKNFQFTEIYLKVIISVLTLVAYIIFVYFKKRQKKNLTSLPGIGFVIISSNIEKEDVEKNMFFQDLKVETKGIYKIKVYKEEDIKKYIKDETIDDSIMPKLNLTILLEIEEKKGKKNSEEIYKISIKDATVYITNTPFPMPTEMLENVKRELSFTINEYIEVSTKNNLKDSERTAKTLKIEFDYIMILLTALSIEPEKSLSLLDNLSYEIKSQENYNKKLKHIRKSIPYRYLEVYSNYEIKLFNDMNFFKNESSLEYMLGIVNNHKKIIEKYHNNQEINKETYEFGINNLITAEAMILCEIGSSKEALEKILEFDYSQNNNIIAYFLLGYIYAHNKEYEKSYDAFFKLLKRKDINMNFINSILDFLERKIKFRKSEECEFCYLIIYYYKKDRKLAKEYLKEISDKNDSIKKVFIKMRNNRNRDNNEKRKNNFEL